MSQVALIKVWADLLRRLSQLLYQDEPEAQWLPQFESLTTELLQVFRDDPDTALYLSVQNAFGRLEHYSAHHAILCAQVCDLCASYFELSASERDALVRAALTMNCAMSALQDKLVLQHTTLTDEQRDEIDAHARRSAGFLKSAGVTDTCWLDIVSTHHDASELVDEAAGTVARLAQLLYRVDVFTAKLSRRASRHPTTPARAAREACLDKGGAPDAVGATILRVMGLYPPGCFVLLSNGDSGVVVRRGNKAHTPLVAALRRSDGGMHMQPVLRDSATGEFGVVRGVALNAAKVRLDHERILGAL
ncbi:MAG: hypothetical protein JOY60_13085 [Burkholderiaceae bacterium]|nr:hypothetical protein [Burkholderiaceae bacterium]